MNASQTSVKSTNKKCQENRTKIKRGKREATWNKRTHYICVGKPQAPLHSQRVCTNTHTHTHADDPLPTAWTIDPLPTR